jgi:hypothetical protein
MAARNSDSSNRKDPTISSFLKNLEEEAVRKGQIRPKKVSADFDTAQEGYPEKTGSWTTGLEKTAGESRSKQRKSKSGNVPSRKDAEPTIGPQFDEAGDMITAVIANLKFIDISRPFEFKPKIIKDPRAGEIYVYGGIGPVVCEGIKAQKADGINLETVSFREIHAFGAPRTIHRPLTSYLKNPVRALCEPADLDQLLARMNANTMQKIQLPRRLTDITSKFEGLLRTTDLTKTCALIMHSVGGGVKDRTTHEIHYGLLAERMLAAEYAVVKNVDLPRAVTLVRRVISEPETTDVSSRKEKPAAAPKAGKPDPA